jgi:hypothetical protein
MATLAVTEAVTSLRNAHELLNLARSPDPDFFTEWRDTLPELTPTEVNAIAHLTDRYLQYLEEGEISEGTANIIMLTTPRFENTGIPNRDFRTSDLYRTHRRSQIRLYGLPKGFPLLFTSTSFCLSPMKPLCYRHFCVMQVCPHGMLSPFHSGHREGNCNYIIAAKAARVAFPLRIKIAGLPRSRTFPCHPC